MKYIFLFIFFSIFFVEYDCSAMWSWISHEHTISNEDIQKILTSLPLRKIKKAYSLAMRAQLLLQSINNYIVTSHHLQRYKKHTAFAPAQNNALATKNLLQQPQLKHEALKHLPLFINAGADINCHYPFSIKEPESPRENDNFKELANPTRLAWAIYRGDEKLAQYLLAHGGNGNETFNIVYYAEKSKTAKFFDKLLDALVNKYICNHWSEQLFYNNLLARSLSNKYPIVVKNYHPLCNILWANERKMAKCVLGYAPIEGHLLSKYTLHDDIFIFLFANYLCQLASFDDQSSYQNSFDITNTIALLILGLKDKEDQRDIIVALEQYIECIIQHLENRIYYLGMNAKNLIAITASTMNTIPKEDATFIKEFDIEMNQQSTINISDSYTFCFDSKNANNLLSLLFSHVPLNELSKHPGRQDMFLAQVTFLLAQGAYIDIYVPYGTRYITPLQKAIFSGNKEIASFLLRSGAHPDMISSDGLRPLQFVSQKSPDIIKLLLEYGMDINLADSCNKSVLNNLCDQSSMIIIFRHALEHISWKQAGPSSLIKIITLLNNNCNAPEVFAAIKIMIEKCATIKWILTLKDLLKPRLVVCNKQNFIMSIFAKLGYNPVENEVRPLSTTLLYMITNFLVYETITKKLKW